MRELDKDALYVALDRERRRRRISMREVARQAGLPQPAVLTRPGRGSEPSVHNLVRMLEWPGTAGRGPFLRESREKREP
jgi:hypothetical protein